MNEIKNGVPGASNTQFFIKIAVNDGQNNLFFVFQKFNFCEIKLQPMDKLWSAPSSSESILNL